ncbi:DNA polymerase III subunits gamma and tau [Mycoplasmopsis canis PG 14]|uniref:DNA polymerase III subunit gamma/tau n=1 Tax=Mycoplasmopsis canis TaxID=29555 RepID=A0A449AS54_9BACT|nr:DNA polymerase III subunit gamma/tau [Mycoplasmopsis canis]AMD81541.1 DNA polymerase [Mycoplasmopsis canis PG 14]EIE39440.1 DNA polymerase III subunits gamma and tau [Mycoplasmopsis canis PG 14]VEU69172.1 DNA-directed DNA polymerase [Mycoplasmopsis canis]
MSDYKTLYRKYRPKTFEQVVGQEHVIKTLKNILTNRKIGHAYLFTGPKGTGKTSISKIFASVLNCVHSSEPTKACNFCLENLDNNLDIIEMDAASNNGVDEIRLLKEKVEQAPINGKFKIYIIDEVHMLSKSAFNALLKTLEEPPFHTIFILATTDPQKIPLTILSRVQRYNFKRISDNEIISHLKEILDIEKIKYEERALKTIALLSTGGMRDALSIADQASSFNDNFIDQESIERNFGVSSVDNYIKLLNKILEGNVKEIISTTNDFNDSGADANKLIKALMNLVKEWLLYSKTKDISFLNWITHEQLLKIKLSQSNAIIIYDELYEIFSKISRHESPYELIQIAFIALLEKIEIQKSNHTFMQNLEKPHIPEISPKIEETKKDSSISKFQNNSETQHITKENKVENSQNNDFFLEIQNDTFINKKFSADEEEIFKEEDLLKKADEMIRQTNEFFIKLNEQNGDYNDLSRDLDEPSPNTSEFAKSELINTREITFFDKEIQNENHEEYLKKVLNALLYAKFKNEDFSKQYGTIKKNNEILSEKTNTEFVAEKELLKKAKLIGATKDAIIFVVSDEEALQELRSKSKDYDIQSYVDYLFSDGYKTLFFISINEKEDIANQFSSFRTSEGKIKIPFELYRPEAPALIDPKKANATELFNSIFKEEKRN